MFTVKVDEAISGIKENLAQTKTKGFPLCRDYKNHEHRRSQINAATSSLLGHNQFHKPALWLSILFYRS
jgi:hypothetical protein